MNWWDADYTEESNDDVINVIEKKEEISEEQKETKRMIELIQAQEKTRCY